MTLWTDSVLRRFFSLLLLLLLLLRVPGCAGFGNDDDTGLATYHFHFILNEGEREF